MKLCSVTRKTLVEYWREPLILGLIFAFPIMMLGLYYIAFSETDQGLASYLKVLVVNEDVGGTTPAGERQQAGAQLITVLRTVEFEGDPIFDVSLVTDQQAAAISLRERKASLLLIIPPDFTQALLDAAAGAHRASPALISLLGDPNWDGFVFARSMLDEFVRQFTCYAVGQDIVQVVDYEFLTGSGTMSDFDFGVAGLIVFGLSLTTITTAQTMVNENVNGTLRRLRLTRVRAGDLLLGVALAQMIIALVLVPVTFGAALVMGFRGHGSLPLAIGIGLLLNLSWVGLGLAVACFAHNDGEAANLGGTLGVLMVLLSGAMYPMPDAPIATIAGRTIQIYDVLPPAHAAEAMRRVLVSGDGCGAIGYELVMLTFLALIMLALGTLLYQRLQLRQA